VPVLLEMPGGSQSAELSVGARGPNPKCTQIPEPQDIPQAQLKGCANAHPLGHSGRTQGLSVGNMPYQARVLLRLKGSTHVPPATMPLVQVLEGTRLCAPALRSCTVAGRLPTGRSHKQRGRPQDNKHWLRERERLPFVAMRTLWQCTGE